MAAERKTQTQKELESTVKGYQLQNLEERLGDKLATVLDTLKEIKDNTKGVVTHDAMEKFVREYVKNELQPIRDHKKNVTKLGWAILLLIVGDIVSRVLGSINGGT